MERTGNEGNTDQPSYPTLLHGVSEEGEDLEKSKLDIAEIGEAKEETGGAEPISEAEAERRSHQCTVFHTMGRNCGEVEGERDVGGKDKSGMKKRK